MATIGPEQMAIVSKLEDVCLEIFDQEPTNNVSEILLKLMSQEEVPMHFPYHHFIVPASLLTAIAYEKGISRQRLAEMLNEAKERGMQVPGGCCGNFGACGAGIGTGIFMSIYTDSNPLATQTWSWGNEMTGLALQAISGIPGPRCCKRTCFIAIQTAVPYINEKLDAHLVYDMDQKCTFHKLNKECKGKLCPFFPAGE